MITIITKVFVIALALVVTANVLPGVALAGPYAAIIAAIILGFLNILVRPVLIVLTLPITVVTLGLFIFVINAAMLLLVAYFVDGFVVSGFWMAVLASLIISVISTVINRLIT
tara:strand:+ start:3405 stop:3743 length:339 start_codon:yes stop_codon:yes gene_type:complete